MAHAPRTYGRVWSRPAATPPRTAKNNLRQKTSRLATPKGGDRDEDISASLLFAFALLLATPLAAQDYPTKPIRLIVPFAAGGPADMLARAIVPSMSSTLKQSVVIENRTGAGGTIGVDAVAKAPPDGYTVGIAGPGALVSIPFMTTVPYNVERDIVPVARIATVSGVIVAGPKPASGRWPIS